MTTAQTMHARRGLAGLVLWLLAALGCSSGPAERPLVMPLTTVAPYDVRGGELLWAVVPLRNESGTVLADPLQVSDKVVAAVQEVEGIACLPLNRTLEAMRALNLQMVTTPAEVRALADALAVDGLVIGSITAWDPYDPPVLGMSLALYARGDAMRAEPAARGLDTRALSARPAEVAFPASGYDDGPASVVSEHLDARNHETLMNVKGYAFGRADERRALGWMRYTASMDLYMEFGAHLVVRRLLARESERIGPPIAAAGE